MFKKLWNKLKAINTIAAILASFVAIFTPACGSILALYSRVEAQGVEIQMNKNETTIIKEDIKKILEDTGYIRGQLENSKRRK